MISSRPSPLTRATVGYGRAQKKLADLDAAIAHAEGRRKEILLSLRTRAARAVDRWQRIFRARREASESKHATRYNTKKCKDCGAFTSALVTDADYRAAQLSKEDSTGAMGKGATKSGFYFIRGSGVLDCRGCGKPKYAFPVRGTLKPEVKCNAKCLASHGFVCECSCGGKNHGASS